MITTNKEELLIGLISDTHVPVRVSSIPERIINDFKEKNVDYVFHMGDFVSMDVYEGLKNAFGKEKFFAVLGNMDSDEDLEKTLPKMREFELLCHKFLMVHGSGGPNMIIRRLKKAYNLTEAKYDIVIFGHTHHPVNEVKDGILFLNPGTTTPIDGRLTVVSSYGFLKISKDKLEPEIIIMDEQ